METVDPVLRALLAKLAGSDMLPLALHARGRYFEGQAVTREAFVAGMKRGSVAIIDEVVDLVRSEEGGPAVIHFLWNHDGAVTSLRVLLTSVDAWSVSQNSENTPGQT